MFLKEQMSLRKTTEIYCFILVDKTRYIDPKKIQDNSIIDNIFIGGTALLPLSAHVFISG